MKTFFNKNLLCCRWFVWITVLFLPFTLTSCDIIKTQWLRTSAQNAMSKGEYDKALPIVKKLIKREPENFHHEWNLGVIYAKKGQLKKAKQQANILRKRGKKKLAKQLDEYIIKITVRGGGEEIMMQMQ